MAELGKRIKHLLAQEEINTQEMANRVGLNPGTLKYYMTAKGQPTMETLQKILHTFPNWSPSYLILGIGEPLASTGDATESVKYTMPDKLSQAFDFLGYKYRLRESLDSLSHDSYPGLLAEALANIDEILSENEKLKTIYGSKH